MPGAHGPTPELIGLEDQFVFLGYDLSQEVAAVNTVRIDTITLSATALPDGATFPAATNTNRVTSTLNWIAPPAGVYSATFQAEGDAGTHTETIQITVSGTTQIDGYFYGWENGTIVKLKNGQFWVNTGGVGSTVDPRLRNPDITITNYFGQNRITVESVNHTTGILIDVIESDIESAFNGLRNGNIYELEDGTFWKQISFENISSTAGSVTAWRWSDNGKMVIRFLDRYAVVIGTCTVEPSERPEENSIISEIDGYFRGWKNKRIFALKNGQFWQQTVAKNTSDTLLNPVATVTNYLETGTYRLYIENATAPAYVEVQQLINVTRTAIDGIFYGFTKNEFFHLQNGTWWRQTSIDSSASTRSNPEIFIWNDDGTDIIEMPDEGRTVAAKQLTILEESTVTNNFDGLHYGNIYDLADGAHWIQISFENISDSSITPDAVLWLDDSETNLLLRTDRDKTIGTCQVVDPDADTDGDQVANADELIAGTALDDADDLFLITDIQYDNEGRAVLSWNAVEGRSYSVEWTPSLTENFQTLETDAIPDWTDVYNAPGTGGFYRIRAQLID